MTHHALWQLFRTRYGLQAQPALTLLDYQSASQQDGQLSLQATLRHHGETRRLAGPGQRPGSPPQPAGSARCFGSRL